MSRYQPESLVDQGLAQPHDRHVCPCGRTVFASRTVHVGGFPAGLYPDGATDVCDACAIAPVYQGRLTLAGFAYYSGAPADAVQRAHDKDVTEQAAGNLRPVPDVVDAPAGSYTTG